MNPAILARHVFNYSVARSLTNAFRKSMILDPVLAAASTISLADSGTASIGLKANVAAYAAGLALLALALVTGEPLWAAVAAAWCSASTCMPIAACSPRSTARAACRSRSLPVCTTLRVRPVAGGGAGAAAGCC